MNLGLRTVTAAGPSEIVQGALFTVTVQIVLVPGIRQFSANQLRLCLGNRLRGIQILKQNVLAQRQNFVEGDGQIVILEGRFLGLEVPTESQILGIELLFYFGVDLG